MLSQLHIENIAVIERADLELEAGFNVLTGETGAGKSILIDSINFALGERTSKDIVRSGATAAHVAALFTEVSPQAAERLAELGYACEEDGSLLISRDLSADGRGSCRISGRPATVSLLREIGRLLVNIHGQHDNQALLSPENHVRYLDSYAGLADELKSYAACYARLKETERQLARLRTDETEKARRIDLLTYQIGDIEAVSPREGEDEELTARRNIIQNAEKITRAVAAAYEALSGGDSGVGAQGLAAAAADELSAIAGVFPDIEALSSRLTGLSCELDDCVSELRGYAGDTEYAVDDLDSIEQRLDALYRLKLKYGGSIEEVLRYYSRAKEELDALDSSELTMQTLTARQQKEKAEALAAAEVITKRRLTAAAEMEQKIQTELVFLEMPGVGFKVQIEPLGQLSPGGADAVEFMLSANPGSPLRPLARIASGGEISRVMLGIKTVLAGNDDIDTLIFDEIDTGVSGRAAQKIGMKLRAVAQSSQVVCVTHLAQIASQAVRHILIEKNVSGEKTYTVLKVLDFEGRRRELARIIGGVEITELTLQNAAEMLRSAGTAINE